MLSGNDELAARPAAMVNLNNGLHGERLMNAPSFPSLQEADERLPLVTAMPEEPVLPLSVEAYHALLKAGIIQDGDPVELLEGFLVLKMGRGPKHERARRRLRRLLERIVSDAFFVDEQGAFTTTTSEPEPDVFVIRGTIDDYADRHAAPEELALVVEIADSSVRRDRNWKQRIYARAGIACYWIVNVVDDCVEVFTQPSGPTKKPSFGQTTMYQTGDEIPVVIDGKEIGRIAVAEILGEPKSKR
jgi:Putative restriction endonuclease